MIDLFSIFLDSLDAEPKAQYLHAMTQPSSRWDLIGIALSGLCIVHCLAVPVVLLLFPLFGQELLHSEDYTHAIFLAFILGIAGFAFFGGYRTHGQMRPVLWMAAGIAFVIFATFFAHDHVGHFWEPVFAIVGSLALIRAHILNHRCKQCEARGHENHDLHSHE